MGKSFTLIDHGYEGEEFTRQFIKQEFTSDSLSRIIQAKAPNREELVNLVHKKIRSGEIDTDKLWSEYITRDCNWISFKLGSYQRKDLQFQNPNILLHEFGQDDWYGPIEKDNKQYIIRTYRISAAQGVNYRWTVICEIAPNYIALMWRGFTVKTFSDQQQRGHQFEFWKDIPDIYETLQKKFLGRWQEINLYQFVLQYLWSKYNQPNEAQYSWLHEGVRATSSGVTLNARTGKVLDIQGGGLTALSKALAESCLSAQNLQPDLFTMPKIEDALTKTLMREWGTRSYEFSLKQEIENSKQLEKSKKMIRAHCYFGNGNVTQGQDNLQHIKCYAEWGGARAVLNFILKELRDRDERIKSIG